MIVLVTGGRNYRDRDVAFASLDQMEPNLVIQGGAKGADSLAVRWAADREVPCLTYPAKWKDYGKKAGPRRNACMLDLALAIAAADCELLVCLAFPGGRGTADMVRRCHDAAVLVSNPVDESVPSPVCGPVTPCDCYVGAPHKACLTHRATGACPSFIERTRHARMGGL